MGIPRLKGHLLRYEEAVWLGRTAPQGQENTRNITSVVIDGPALVYHVYYGLMAAMEQHLNPFSAQPASDEVSVGVMKMLLHLRAIGVTVEKIYFDGALPPSKRKVRLERMAKLASKLQQACQAKKHGFKSGTVAGGRPSLDTKLCFSRRLVNPKFYGLPDNPFMVATVAEDLKYRWSWQAIKCYHDLNDAEKVHGSLFPWADITEVVLGEADIFCAEAARERGSAVLTGDSDLVIHDLGSDGSVVFLESIEMYEFPDTNESELRLPSFGVRAKELRPSRIANQLGIRNLLRVGYELKQDPYVKWSTISKLCQAAEKKSRVSSSYGEFLAEYNTRPFSIKGNDNGIEFPLLDSKVSELVAQYHHPSFHADGHQLYSYLPVMTENHARRCAWVDCSDIRALGYSIFNISFPKNKRGDTVLEHARRGQRIVPTPITLLNEDPLSLAAKELLEQIQSVRLSSGSESIYFWVSYALLRIYSDAEHSSLPKPDAIIKFFKFGYMGCSLTWDDLHLRAQVLCTLYSLRMLKQFLQVSLFTGDAEVQRIGKPLLDMLVELPPLRILSEAGIWLNSCTEKDMKSMSDTISTLFECLGSSQIPVSDADLEQEESGDIKKDTPNRKKRKREKRTTNPPAVARRRQASSSNMYDILQSTSDP
ncbi:TPA_exp: Uncharacterized protein A8136_5686 [Trichophyton benhamiae CBS 112371]|uniref:Asteroid domain-containing protein n=1 Tax=Arthroderma benhamiae (strain ATCC MYA-4681 / CBS 112371) TaxID=663331 RepID=D4AP71_ARTBC|nr:uncharacterized protein ARB_06038 [Trichophyton benhamiae CBS 112371]EFE35082.1 hypothetical protein ARB_06038 [Trichophyton benhamiae CBS 112371]DAA77983.1 TPA_exp: Uncharacterized protein A8136_5686 [Trichophyton benhamiae CBS 112371]